MDDNDANCGAFLAHDRRAGTRSAVCGLEDAIQLEDAWLHARSAPATEGLPSHVIDWFEVDHLASAAPVLLRDVAADKITHCSDGCVPMSPATSAPCRVRSGGHQRRETDRHSLAEKCQPAGRMTAITVGLHNLNHDEFVWCERLAVPYRAEAVGVMPLASATPRVTQSAYSSQA